MARHVLERIFATAAHESHLVRNGVAEHTVYVRGRAWAVALLASRWARRAAQRRETLRGVVRVEFFDQGSGAVVVWRERV